MVKIADAIREANENKRHFIGLEFVAPTTKAGIVTLYDRIERMSSLDPLFCGITWDETGDTADTSIEVASTCQSLLSVNYQVNITGFFSSPADVLRWLSILKAKGIHNLLLTRGSMSTNRIHSFNDGGNARTMPSACENTKEKDDGVDGHHGGTASSCFISAFPHAVDLIRFVRKHFRDYFGIAVVAFPESLKYDAAEPGANTTCSGGDPESEFSFLRDKVDAGADYIITNYIFDCAVFQAFCHQCRKRGIRCPILPSVLPLFQLRHMRSFGVLGLGGAAELASLMESSKDNEGGLKKSVVTFYQKLMKQLLECECGGVYVFTMNMDTSTIAILKGIEVTTHRALPWRLSENEERRRQETVRPVHWSSRVTSYMVRTAQWKQFQSEKWNTIASSNHSSALSLGETAGYHARLLLRSRAKRCTQFLAIQGITDVQRALTELCRIFVSFLDGYGTLPWADELSGETAYVNEHILKPLNARGLFTINSQPPVNGTPSSHKVVGWGPGDGYIYQKGYVEFFCALSAAQTIFTTLEKHPSLQYMAMNRYGKLVRARWHVEDEVEMTGASAVSPNASASSNTGDSSPTSQPCHVSMFGSGVTAVTWGVFPGREIIQPTIVSVDSFRVWVGEAFDLWEAPFPSNDIPAVVRYIQSELVLISVVDNAYQTSPAPLERAVIEVCAKIPPLIPIDLTKLQPASSPKLSASNTVTNTLGTFMTT